jgi:hypothetical protein
MDYVLARMAGVDTAAIKTMLKEHAPVHAGQGMFLQHFWVNIDVPGEVQFLFRVDNLARARAFIEQNHADARRQDPCANIPHMTFLGET